MKKFALLFLILFFATVTFAQEEILPKREAYSNFSNNNSDFHNMCTALAKNFKPDYKFSNYLKNRCTLFEADRENLMGIVFPFPNHREEGYNAKYPSYVANYSTSLNKEETEQLKTLVNKYCEHNAYKFVKKDNRACTAERLKSLFEQTKL